MFLPLTLSLYKQECGKSDLVDRNHALIRVQVISKKHDFYNEHGSFGGEEGEELKEPGPDYL